MPSIFPSSSQSLVSRSTAPSSTIGIIIAVVVGVIMGCALTAIAYYALQRRRRLQTDDPHQSEKATSPVYRELKATPLSHVRTHSTTPLLNDTASWAQSQSDSEATYQEYDTNTWKSNERTRPVVMRASTLPPSPRQQLPHLIIPNSPTAISSLTYAHAKPVATVDVLTPASALPSARTSPSAYSQCSASTERQPTYDDYPFPPMPPLPANYPWQVTFPEETPLSRGDTVIVSQLLKSRAQKGGDVANHSFAQFAQIERGDSIRSTSSESGGIWEQTTPR